MNTFFWSMPRPKANQAKRYGSPAFVLRRSGRIVVPATATFMPEPNLPTRAKRAARVLWPGPLKESGEKCCRISSSWSGGINGHGPPLLGREINRGWRSRFTLQFAIWMRKVGELARFQQGPLRYNSNHGTRLSWGAGLNSARWEWGGAAVQF